MLSRLFAKRSPAPDPAPRVRAEPEFDVEGERIVARSVCIYWQEEGRERKLALSRNLRPPEPEITRAGSRFGLILHRDGAVDKVVAGSLDFGTACDLHRVVWNWLGQLCQNGHDPFPRKLTLPSGGFAHDLWPEAGKT